MHELAPLIKDLAIILGIASFVTLLFQKIRQPIVLGYLIAGVAIGPYTPPHILVNDISNIKILSELGVIFLIFSLGLEFSFHKLKRVGFSATVTAIIEVVFMLTLGLAIGKFIGWGFYDSLFLSAALAISSTTIIIKTLEELKLKTTYFAEIVFGVLVIEDLLAILLMLGLSTIVATSNIFSFAMVFAAIKLILVTTGWFIAGYFILPSLLKKITQFVDSETLTILSIALCLLLVWVSNYFHYSAALGAFVMGSILAETTLVHRISQLIRPIRDIFAAVFFVSVGMLIDPISIWQQWPIVTIICLVTIFGKLLSTGVGAFLTGQNLNTSLRAGFSMAQVGEFSFVIIGLGAALGVISDSLYPIIVAVSVVTTFTTPYFIRFSGYLCKRLDRNLSVETKHSIAVYSNWITRHIGQSKQDYDQRSTTLRFIINAIVVAIIFTIVQYLTPNFISVFKTIWVSRVTGWLIGIIFSLPFIWGMLTAYTVKNAHKKQQSITFYVAWLLTISEIAVLSLIHFETWQNALLALLATLFFFFVFYRYIGGVYYFFQNRLIENLSDQSDEHISHNSEEK